MKMYEACIRGVSRFINKIGGGVLIAMMLLTVVDVILRGLRMGITGTFELMSFGGALVAGFAIAQTSMDNGHVNVDILTGYLGGAGKIIVTIVTKLIGIVLFALLAWSLILKGNELYTAGEVSLTLHVPFYPVAYALALGSIVECFVLLGNILKTLTGANHE